MIIWFGLFLFISVIKDLKADINAWSSSVIIVLIIVCTSSNEQILDNNHFNISSFEIAVYRIPQEHIVKSFVIAVIGITSHFNCNWACVPSINNTSP